MIKIVSTWNEAIELSFKLSSEYAVMICDNIYNSDKDFNGVIIKVNSNNAK